MSQHDFDNIMRRQQAMRAALPEHFDCDRHGSYPSGRESAATVQLVCPACQAEADAATIRWKASWRMWRQWENADVPLRYQNRSLQNWKPRTPGEAKTLQAVNRWFEQSVDGGDLQALVLSGPPGLGKTHLAVGLIVATIRCGSSARYVATRELLPTLRASYDRDSQVRPEQILEPLHAVGLLVLDDVGTGRGTAWEQEVIGDLIDARYRDGGAVVITSNATPSELPVWIGERAADRLREFGATVLLAGESYRPKVTGDRVLKLSPPSVETPPTSLVATLTVRGKPEQRVIERADLQARR